MKKLLYVLLVVLLLCTTACSADDGHATVTGSDDPIITIEGKDYTKNDFYEAMMAANATGVVLQKLSDMIYDVEIGTDDTEILAEAEKDVQDLKNTAGEMIDIYLQIYGYSSVEEYRMSVITYLKQNAIIKKYLNANFEENVKTIAPRKVQIIQAKSKEDADKALEELRAGKDFKEVAKQYSTTNFKGDVQIVHRNTTTIDEVIVDMLAVVTEPTLTSQPLMNVEKTYWYVVNFVETDPNQFKDELIEQLAAEDTKLSDKAFAYYAKKGNFKVFDIDLYKEMQKSYSDYLSEE